MSGIFIIFVLGFLMGTLGESPLEVWPNAVVRYNISGLFPEHTRTIEHAMNEYSNKTCLTFVPIQPTEIPSTSSTIISYDPSTLCTTSSHCNKGANFITFGLNCNTPTSGVHELGRNLCLPYEHTRPDRDYHLNYSPATCGDVSRIPSNYTVSTDGFYDYLSAMHYPCDSCLVGTPKPPKVTSCGPSITPGLSLLDVDKINKNFACGGCHRHRWVGVPELTSSDRNNMFSFGYADLSGESLYPCRVQLNGAIVVGKYVASKGACFVRNSGSEMEFKFNAAVLTIPGGLSRDGYTYRAVDVNKIGDNFHAVPAGHAAQSPTQTYVAFATVFTSGGHIEEAIGEVDLSKSKPRAVFMVKGIRTYQSCFSVLICQKF